MKLSAKRPQASTRPSPTPRHAPAASEEGKQALCPGMLARPAAQGVQGLLPEREKVFASQAVAGEGGAEGEG